MARLQTYKNGNFLTAAFDFNFLANAPDLWGTNTTIRGDYPSGSWFALLGRFTYNGSNPSGTVTGIEEGFVGSREWRITGLRIDEDAIETVMETTSTKDDLALLRQALSGADTLIGANYSDNLNGFAGNDLIIGRGGKDTLWGGGGQDSFRFDTIAETAVDARDTIRDFKRGEDRIDLSKIDADQNGTAGNQRFKFIGKKGFTGHDGELRFFGGSVYGDVNGDTVADFAIKVAGVKALAAGDFVL